MKSNNSLAFAAGAAFAIAAIIPTNPAVAASKESKKAPATEASEPIKMAPATGAVPLTRAECEGLGGTARYTVACGKKNQAACVTIDPNGVIRTTCINKK